MEDSDIALMERIGEGDIAAFESLISRHQRPVFNLARRFLNDECEAEDIAQETFIRVFGAAKSYRPEAKFTTWLYAIVKNLCFNAIRKKQGIDLVSLDEETVPEVAAKGDDPCRRLEKKEVRTRVIRAVQSLPVNLRIAVILQKFNGLSYEEVADILGCSLTAVKLRIHRAKDFLARELADIEKETK